MRRESFLFFKTRKGHVVWYGLSILVCIAEGFRHSVVLDPVTTLAELDVGEQQVVNFQD